MTRHTALFKVAALLALLLTTTQAVPYSVQTHEQLIDLAWKQSIRPLLLMRFPTLTEPQLQEAHAYAYGGCAIQDLGYYPFGKPFYSNLMHHVRSGDFIRSLLRNARTADELAFAIGALSHYVADNTGHAEAINLSVPVEFPKLRKKFGPVVNYGENEHAHIRTEFAFDINEISKRRFAPAPYLKHVGLYVSTDLLRRSFFETYGLDLQPLLGKKQRVVRGYRFAIRSFLPRIASAETVLHKKGFPPDTPGAPINKLEKELAQSEFENGWEQFRTKPGIGTYTLAGLIFILPKIGPLSDLAIRGPIPRTQEMYVESLNHTTDSLRQILSHFDRIAQALPNRDLDTGAQVKPGGYHLTDETYAHLLAELTSKPTQTVPLRLQQDINDYYADPNAPISTKKDPARWALVQARLKTLQTMATTTDPDPDVDTNTDTTTPSTNSTPN
jgi:hypothetical protein